MKNNENDRHDPHRRRFVCDCMKYAAGLALLNTVNIFEGCSSGRSQAATSSQKVLQDKTLTTVSQNLVSRATKGTPYDLTFRAVESLGGMDKFVHDGERVMLMPNIAWDRSPEQAATTHPDVVRAVIEMCKKAGAKDIGVVCFTCQPAPTTYKKTQIADIAEKAGAKVWYVEPGRDFVPLDVNGKNIKTVNVYNKLLEADRFISIPIAKVHSLSKYTMCFKNLMGAIEDRPALHPNIQQDLADLSMVLKPDLNIIDASRILVKNGPTGGSLADVRNPEIVIASANPVSADSVGLELFGQPPGALQSLKIAKELGRGEYDLSLLEIREA
jgi:uncharacterized protein (DUF362 family)